MDRFPLRAYCLENKVDGAIVLRPWQLPHRMDFGLRGTGDAVQYSVVLH